MSKPAERQERPPPPQSAQSTLFGLNEGPMAIGGRRVELGGGGMGAPDEAKVRTKRPGAATRLCPVLPTPLPMYPPMPLPMFLSRARRVQSSEPGITPLIITPGEPRLSLADLADECACDA